MGLKTSFLKVASFITGGISTLICGSMITETIVSFSADVAVGALMSGSIAGASLYNAQRLVKKQKKELLQKRQLAILRLAVSNYGQITPTQVALQMDLPLEVTKEILDGLAKEGAIDLKVSHQGNLVYTMTDELYLENHMDRISRA